jgi:antitoxin component of MazEF toxin-antitoxin module
MPIVQEVRVTRSGNTRAFPVPAAVARLIGLEAGDQFELEVIGESVLYRKVGVASVVAHSGEGTDRLFTPHRGRTVFLPSTTRSENDSLLNDWDF